MAIRGSKTRMLICHGAGEEANCCPRPDKGPYPWWEREGDTQAIGDSDTANDRVHRANHARHRREERESMSDLVAHLRFIGRFVTNGKIVGGGRE